VQLSRDVSLAPAGSLPHNRRTPSEIWAQSTIVNPLRFSETINGRSYEIEVQSVGADRWRAYLARAAGAPTALMPFYGGTPDEAAHRLTLWLTRASRPSKPV
jgi:hypothetical protein